MNTCEKRAVLDTLGCTVVVRDATGFKVPERSLGAYTWEVCLGDRAYAWEKSYEVVIHFAYKVLVEDGQ
jgi:hypothetical protein